MFTVQASADDSAQANRLLVEAAILAREAYHTGATEKPELLGDVLAKLNKIVAEHPSSDLAVQIITDQQIGFLSLGNIARSLCAEHILAGNFQSALDAAKQIADVAVFEQAHHEIGLAQAKAGDFQAALATAISLSDSRLSSLSLMSPASPSRPPARTYRRDTDEGQRRHRRGQ